MKSTAKPDQSGADAINKATAADVKKQEDALAAEGGEGLTGDQGSPAGNTPDPDEQSAAREKLETERTARKAGKVAKPAGKTDAEMAKEVAKKTADNAGAKKTAKKAAAPRATNAADKKDAKAEDKVSAAEESTAVDNIASQRQQEADDAKANFENAQAIADKAADDAKNVGNTTTATADTPRGPIQYRGDNERHIAKKRAALKATLVNLRDLRNDIKNCSPDLMSWLDDVDNAIEEVNLV